MIDYSDVDAMLDQYSAAFDLYMERGEMPPAMTEDDCLLAYMKEVIDNNPQIDGSDPIWVEVLKESLISFFKVLLEQFRKMQIEAMKELEQIERFNRVSIEEKRKMWARVYKAISSTYSKYEVNLQGYTEQFRTNDRNAVFAAMTSDWNNACRARLDRRQRQMLEQSKAKFEQISQEAGTSDYNDRKKLDKYIHRYPQLREIVEMIGRDKDPTKNEKDTVIFKFLPVTVTRNPSVEEIDRIESGDNLERVLPSEMAMPDDLFFKRYATKELQQFSSPGKDKPRKTEDHRKDPRLTKGPVIVSVDTSGSMSGQPLRIAFSLLRQLLRMAKRQKRPCFLISFSVRAKSVDLSKPGNWGKLDKFLENSFSGGTDGEQMLSEAIRVLEKGTFEMADVLIISDLQFPAPALPTREKIAREQSLGTRFYALRIGNYSHSYGKILDRIWTI